MKTVVITGAAGFVGKNLISFLGQRDDLEILPYDLTDGIDVLRDYAARADVAVHLAGVNRPKDPADYVRGNHGFTVELLGMLEKPRRPVTLIFASSIQAALSNPYGLSKKMAEDAIRAWLGSMGNRAYIYRFPNLFGKWCRPNYNSVVATFCHNIARGLPIRIDSPDVKLTLAYIDDVIAEIADAIDGKGHVDEDGFAYVPRTFTITVGELADKIRSYETSRTSLMVPDLSKDLDRFLYATYTSYLSEPKYSLDMKHDNRGWFAEFLKSAQFGQISLSRTKPGITRGNHWHHTKVEKFLVVEGEAVIRIRRIDSNEVSEIFVSGQQLSPVEIPVGCTHSITNVGQTDLVTLFWANEVFDPSRPDTYYLEV
jgi:UDP-2-acetamido-2,6-beta-L-arabino-hexul-4-ose reductase